MKNKDFKQLHRGFKIQIRVRPAGSGTNTVLLQVGTVTTLVPVPTVIVQALY